MVAKTGDGLGSERIREREVSTQHMHVYHVYMRVVVAVLEAVPKIRQGNVEREEGVLFVLSGSLPIN